MCRLQVCRLFHTKRRPLRARRKADSATRARARTHTKRAHTTGTARTGLGAKPGKAHHCKARPETQHTRAEPQRRRLSRFRTGYARKVGAVLTAETSSCPAMGQFPPQLFWLKSNSCFVTSAALVSTCVNVTCHQWVSGAMAHLNKSRTPCTAATAGMGHRFKGAGDRQATAHCTRNVSTAERAHSPCARASTRLPPRA
jgi:hypothetical protein